MYLKPSRKNQIFFIFTTFLCAGLTQNPPLKKLHWDLKISFDLIGLSFQTFCYIYIWWHIMTVEIQTLSKQSTGTKNWWPKKYTRCIWVCTSSVSMFTYRKTTMACYSSIVALKPMTTKRIKQGIINFSESKYERLVGRMLYPQSLSSHILIFFVPAVWRDILINVLFVG